MWFTDKWEIFEDEEKNENQKSHLKIYNRLKKFKTVLVGNIKILFQENPFVFQYIGH